MTNQASTSLRNRRRVARIRTLIETTLVYGDAALPAPCRILDLSPAGAMIEIEESLVLLRPLALLLALDGVAVEARVAWRAGDRAGLAFTRRHPLGGEVPRGLQGLQAIWKARLAG
jgi:hypothetical protein